MKPEFNQVEIEEERNLIFSAWHESIHETFFIVREEENIIFS